MQRICVSLSTGDTVSKYNWGEKLQNFTRYSDGNVNKFLMGVSMQFTVSFEFIYKYWNQVHTKHENLLTISLELGQKQGRE